MKKSLLCLMLLLGGWVAAVAQQRTVSGRVLSADDNSPLPGVNVLVEGTSLGTTTDAEGAFSLEAADDQTLVFSFVGYESVSIPVGSQTTINVTMNPDITSLDEIVVVGYGTQREKDLTSAISTIRADEIVKTPTGQAMQALQGRVPGLQVVSAGTPGSSPTIRVRGVGSYPTSRDNVPLNNEAPLFVVDGMFFDNIDFLNPSDIATISVLKDASAAAIYGVRAANGVVLIETKSGKVNQPPQITYDGYFGYQVAQNVVKMANAEQFTTMAVESGVVGDVANIDNAMQRFGRSRVNPNVPDVNTDWYDEILRPAPIQNHSLNLTGGGERASYSIGTNYFGQQGVLDTKNEYERFNIRTKVDYNFNDWLTVGGNLLLSNAIQYSPEQTAWNLAYFAVPILPVYDELNTAATPIRFASAETIGYRAPQNPFPSMEFFENQQKIRKVLGNFNVRIDLIPDKLTFQSAYNVGSTFINLRDVDLPYFISENGQTPNAVVLKKTETYYNQIWDNILTYNQNFGDHYLTVMAGTSYRDEAYDMLQAKGFGLQSLEEESWYIDQVQNIEQNEVRDDGRRQYGISYFGRIAYNYRDKYLIYGTMRADGTSKYQEKWGYFPTVGVGWVVSEEPFFADNGLVNFLKLRASWGELGNDKIQASDGAQTATTVTTAINDVLVSGTTSLSSFAYLGWEVTEEVNVGITSELFSNKLSLEADYYVRDTKNAAINVTLPLIGGEVLRNVGVIRNSGLELALNWSDNLANGITYNLGANITTLNNEVRDLYGQPYIDGGSAEFRQRSIVGEPILAFFGYEVAGVYQSQEEIQEDPIAVANSLAPGDLKFRDQNDDGVLGPEDRVVLGSYLPSFMFGFNFGASYKNFDLSVNLMGQSGNKILNRKRGEIIWTPDQNMDADLAKNRWHGEGTSNEYPSSAGLRKAWNQRMSDFFVEDGAFFRIQNVNLAYNLRGKRIFGAEVPNTRISLTAERPLTVFQYNGFNPEIPNGIDSQTYPIPAVYTLGLNVTF